MKMKDLALAQVRRGERFTLDGVEFVKLEDDLDAAFAVTADTLPECCQFEDDDAEREDHNNYAGSLLSKTVERWLRDKHPDIFSAVVERPIDLTTMDGMTDYGKPLAVVRALTIDEYRKHRSILPLASKPYWLATGWTTNTKATAKRKISVTLELIPSADRRTITVQSTAKCSLTPTDPVTTSLYITNAPSTGELLVAEMVPQVPGQLALDGEEQDHPKILKFKRQA